MTFFVVNPGPRPPFAFMAEALWGAVDFDSDGDSRYSSDTAWTELTIQRRPHSDERVDIDPVSVSPLVLRVSATSPDLAERAARLLAGHGGAVVVSEWPGA